MESVLFHYLLQLLCVSSGTRSGQASTVKDAPFMKGIMFGYKGCMCAVFEKGLCCWYAMEIAVEFKITSFSTQNKGRESKFQILGHALSTNATPGTRNRS